MSFLSFHLESILFILHWMPSQIFNMFYVCQFQYAFPNHFITFFHNTEYILKVLILFMNWGKRNPHKSNANDRMVHMYTLCSPSNHGSLVVNHVNLFFCSPSFLSQRKTSFHRNSFTSKRNIEGQFVFRSWRTHIY